MTIIDTTETNVMDVDLYNEIAMKWEAAQTDEDRRAIVMQYADVWPQFYAQVLLVHPELQGEKGPSLGDRLKGVTSKSIKPFKVFGSKTKEAAVLTKTAAGMVVENRRNYNASKKNLRQTMIAEGAIIRAQAHKEEVNK